jgi:hypothetical protein
VRWHCLPPRNAVYLNDKGLGETDAGLLRAALAERMEKTSSWLNYERRPGYGVEYHLSNALAAVFLNSAGFRQAPRCYVTALGMPRAVPFIPLLADLAAKAPGLSVALMVLSIGSVSPDYPFLPLTTRIAASSSRRTTSPVEQQSRSALRLTKSYRMSVSEP